MNPIYLIDDQDAINISKIIRVSRIVIDYVGKKYFLLFTIKIEHNDYIQVYDTFPIADLVYVDVTKYPEYKEFNIKRLQLIQYWKDYYESLTPKTK